MRRLSRRKTYFLTGGVGVILVFSFLILNTFAPHHALRSKEDCVSLGAQKMSCYATVLDETLEAKGLPSAFALLATLYSSDPEFASTCHGFTHPIGAKAYQLFHEGKPMELTGDTSYCGFGFFHGFMEELIRNGGSMEEARAFCAYAGRTLITTTRDAEGACYHGIGHGAVDGTDPRDWGDPVALARPGIIFCEEVGKTDAERNRCASGVFNSLAIMYQDKTYKLVIDHDDPYRVCRGFSPDYVAIPCYEEMNTLVLADAQFDFDNAVSFIRKIDGEQYAISAADGLATYHAQMRGRGPSHASVERIISACRTLGTAVGNACIRGYGAGLVESGIPGEEYKQAIAFCENPAMRQGEISACTGRVLNYLSVIYSKEKMGVACEFVTTTSGRKWCKDITAKS